MDGSLFFQESIFTQDCWAHLACHSNFLLILVNRIELLN